MWNELKKDIKFFKNYFKEHLLFSIIIVLLILFLQGSLQNLLLIISTVIVINFFGFVYLSNKRRKELCEIETIINNIRKNFYENAEEIILSENLASLEQAIKEMFIKSKNDIEYMRKLQRVRSEFIANVSHELRTPIFAIQGYIETLLNGAINDSNVNKSFLEKAAHHTNNLSNLLNDLINISMIESGEMQMSFRYFDLAPYIASIVDEMKYLAEEKQISLTVSAIREGLQVFGDKERLKQVLINLIQNAIKYTESGGVDISVEEEKKYVTIKVKDSGIGIPQDQLTRIFERFYRVDKARSRAVGGTGLGLSIVKHIIEAHDSKVEVRSTVGVGSEFSFKLKK
ncbi:MULTISPECIES: ATP-binding protein [Ignavibacterium]|uniref:sensor histidine kinase n=1 Tax=Ignavibacterium TaxID=795750 RepID=UPI0025BBA90B|nr:MULTISPECIES: ATP-binding protein [Ignavibacterium]MBI5663282.1 ATP-binding protein [Ignavibacterium album]